MVFLFFGCPLPNSYVTWEPVTHASQVKEGDGVLCCDNPDEPWLQAHVVQAKTRHGDIWWFHHVDLWQKHGACNIAGIYGRLVSVRHWRKRLAGLMCEESGIDEKATFGD